MSSTHHNKNEKYLKGIVNNLPNCPGCYQYVDEQGEIIYVGKAKDLRRRVSSYFNKDLRHSRKTAILVSKIRDIKYVVVKTETDALLLENNLIKRYKPRYNVLLKDDKTYPSICITNEYFPRIFKTRHILRNVGTYYGPYSHTPTLNSLLELIKNLYPLRTCRHTLTPESIRNGKHSVCLEYHIKNCNAPCVGKENHDEYMKYIQEVKEILKGNTVEIGRKMLEEIRLLAEQLRFEDAQILKQKYDLLEHHRAKSEVVSNILHNIDVFSIETDDQTAYINYLHVTNGCINQAFTFSYKKKLNESDEELLILGIAEMRERYKSFSREIIVPFPMETELENVVFTVPQRGDKKKLLDLSLLNVKQYKLDRLKQSDKLNPEQKTVRILKEIQDHLKLPKIPLHIECFDNSNISGTDAVAACVVFKKGKPSKNDYRKYNIKTVEGPDDYASMKEVVRRRYTRIMEEESNLPDLIITDGGKGQMEVVREVIEDELHLNIPIAGLAKDNRHRTNELLYGNPPVTIGMKTDSPLFHLLTHIQDEVHRFAITFHRNKRSKRQTASQLDQIKGIGEVTKTALLRYFKSVKRIKEADINEVAKVVGQSKAELVYNALNNTSAITANTSKENHL